MTQQKNKLAVKHLMSLAPVSGLVLALAPAAQAAPAAPAAQAATIITDNVENAADYTSQANSVFGGTTIGNDTVAGIIAQAGTNVARWSTGGGGSRAGTVTFTAGFGPTNTIQAGTYVFTMSVGDTESDRSNFQTWNMRLQTVDGFLGTAQGLNGATELSNVDHTVPYVPVASGDLIAQWTTTTKTYTINPGDSLIGKEFTWAADYSNGVGGNKIDGVFDAVSIEFTAIPEPSTFALAALGLLGLVGTRRRRSKA